MTMIDRDVLIRVALRPADDVRAPASLAADIRNAIASAPQRRPILGALRLSLSSLPVPARFAVVLLVALLLAGILIAIASRPPTGPPGLTMYHGGPARTGVTAGPGPAGPPVVLWKASLHGSISFQIMPVVADGRVFVPDDSGSIAALDEKTGGELWSADLGAPVHSSPAVVDGTVIVGTDHGDVTSLAAADGSVRWQFRAGGPVTGSLLFADGVLYVPSEDGLLYALEPTTGVAKWSMDVGGPATRGAAFVDGTIFLGAKGGRFSAIDAGSHAVRWTRELGPGEIGTPTVADGRVYVSRGLLAAAPPHDVIVLDARNGSDLWEFASPAGEQVYFAGVGDGLAYVVSRDRNVYSLEPATGAVRWTFMTEGPIGTLVTIVDHTLYVTGDDHFVRALDTRTGTQVWSVKVDGVPTIAAVIDARVIVGTNLGKVIALGS
jgi:outer membrane protein assembly factor BamB